MLVIHPNDRTTSFLSALYDGMPDVRSFHHTVSRKELNHVLHHTSRSECIMLLGHGCHAGLMWREDDTSPEFDGVVVGHPHTYHLRNHGGNIVAVFCHADVFAANERLSGLFTGMIISEMQEALEYQIETTEEEIERENSKFVMRLRSLLDQKVPLSDVPRRMLELDDVHSPLTEFNYHNIYYL